MTSDAAGYGTWHADPAREAAMGEGHSPYWRHLIGLAPEAALPSRTVLDFGCNRGGFLRLLHRLHPLARGIGVDIARQSVDAANAERGDAPLEYHVATDLARWADMFDLAFSYEVIYLLPDLRDHARQMIAALKPGGVYYAVTGCHTGSPLWPAWRKFLPQITNAPVQDYSIEDIVAAFRDAGLVVTFRRFGYDGFVGLPRDPRYYPRLIDAVTYHAEHKMVFRLARPG